MPLRGYQQTAADAGMDALQAKRNGILVLSTGSGKSHVIASSSPKLNAGGLWGC